MRTGLNCLWLCLAVTLCCLSAASARAEGAAEDLRYEFYKIEGVVHRFDRKTGDVEKLTGTPERLAWVKVEVQPAKPSSAPKQKDDPVKPPAVAARKDVAINLWDDQGNDITEAISDLDRKNAAAGIEAYQSYIGMIAATQTGSRITGVLTIENKGDKRIRALEVTMLVNVIGGEKPEQFRFVLLDKPGATRPPQPALGGKADAAALLKIDVPTPAGGVKGSPEFKVTYLRLAE
jgi:hypothetical protein